MQTLVRVSMTMPEMLDIIEQNPNYESYLFEYEEFAIKLTRIFDSGWICRASCGNVTVIMERMVGPKCAIVDMVKVIDCLP